MTVALRVQTLADKLLPPPKPLVDAESSEDAIGRAVERLLPELTGGYHLPQYRTPQPRKAVRRLPLALCVDVEVLLPSGETDTALPILSSVPTASANGRTGSGYVRISTGGHHCVDQLRLRSADQAFYHEDPAARSSLPRVPKGDQVCSTAKPVSSASTPTATGCAIQTGRSRTRRWSGRLKLWRTLDLPESYQDGE